MSENQGTAPARNQGNDDFRFEICEHIGVLGPANNGWTKEFNMVSWNDAAPKYDIRDWDPTHKRMTRGGTLRVEEAKALSGLLMGRQL